MNPIIIDNFYGDDVIRFANAAKQLSYGKAEMSNYPGSRTSDIREVAPDLWDTFHEKFLRLFADTYPNTKWEFECSIQRIEGPSRADLSSGWVHVDHGKTLSCIVYLSEDPDPNTGTTFCEALNTEFNPNANIRMRNAYYGGRNQITDDEFALLMSNHNRRFKDTINVENKFNRFLAFDPSIPHKQRSFGLPGYVRYTQIVFCEAL